MRRAEQSLFYSFIDQLLLYNFEASPLEQCYTINYSCAATNVGLPPCGVSVMHTGVTKIICPASLWYRGIQVSQTKTVLRI